MSKWMRCFLGATENAEMQMVGVFAARMAWIG
jgi:hypothetical protein